MPLISLFSSAFKPVGNSFKQAGNNIPYNDFDYSIIPNNDLTFIFIPDNDLFNRFIVDNDIQYVLIPDNDIDGLVIPANDVLYRLIPNSDSTYTLVPNDDIKYSILRPEVSPSPTPSITPSITPTSSENPTPTPTPSNTVTPTQTVTPTMTMTPTPTPSRTITTLSQNILFLGDGSVTTNANDLRNTLNTLNYNVTINTQELGTNYTGGDIASGNYSLIIMQTNGGQNGAPELSTNLKNYMDNGGHFIGQTFLWGIAPTGFDYTYTPFTSGGQAFNGGPITTVTSHPVLGNSNITNIGSTFINTVSSLQSGAISVLTYSDNTPLLAVKINGSSRSVGINGYDSLVSSNPIGIMMGNAVLWCLGVFDPPASPTPTVTPTSTVTPTVSKTPSGTPTMSPTPTPSNAALDFTIGFDCSSGGRVLSNGFVGGSGTYDITGNAFATENEALNSGYWIQLANPNVTSGNVVSSSGTYWVAIRDRNNLSNKMAKSVDVVCA